MAHGLFSPALVLWVATAAAACPFCTAVMPSLAQRRAEAAVALLAEAGEANDGVRSFVVHKVLPGSAEFADSKTLRVPTAELAEGQTIRAGQLALLLGMRRDDQAALAWEAVPLDEASYAYVARAPAPRGPARARLPYYARFLEHANPLVAEDAYREFGRASFDEVAAMAGQLPHADLRRWIVDPRIPESRKGFYGLALGLAKTEADRSANGKLLAQLVDADGDDFRGGYDGVLGGYLLLAGPAGLQHVENRLLANPAAPTGDVRHAATALRFLYEFGRASVPQADTVRATRHLLARPDTAAAAIVDLARWQDWEPAPQIAALFDRAEFADAPTSRAIVGYLAACPLPEARAALAALRRQHPARVAEAEALGTFAPANG